VAKAPQRFNKYLRLSTVGLELGLAVLIGLFVGNYLDGYLGTEPWMLLLFLGFGAAAGFRRLYQLLKAISRNSDDEPPAENGASGR